MRTILKITGTSWRCLPSPGAPAGSLPGSEWAGPSRRRTSRNGSAPLPTACGRWCSTGSSPSPWPEPREGVYRDRYEIAGITKLDGDRWRFDARITYGNTDVTLPVVVPILWAGDVPMIRMVDVEIPGLGNEFGATIVFDGTATAAPGTTARSVGFMFGRVVRE